MGDTPNKFIGQGDSKEVCESHSVIFAPEPDAHVEGTLNDEKFSDDLSVSSGEKKDVLLQGCRSGPCQSEKERRGVKRPRSVNLDDEAKESRHDVPRSRLRLSANLGDDDETSSDEKFDDAVSLSSATTWDQRNPENWPSVAIPFDPMPNVLDSPELFSYQDRPVQLALLVNDTVRTDEPAVRMDEPAPAVRVFADADFGVEFEDRVHGNGGYSLSARRTLRFGH